jgi:hypothetical protein
MGSLTSSIGGVLGASNSVLGGLFPLVNNITRVVSLVDTLSGASQRSGASAQRQEQELALRQLQQRQGLQMQQMAQDNALAQQKMAIEAQQAEEQRRAALRRAVARQRAQFGAQGVGSVGGSAEAVLLGLFDESESELKRREQLDQMRNAALNQNYTQAGSLNLLQATQLAERQRLARLI